MKVQNFNLMKTKNIR